MAPDTDAVGKTYPSVTYAVGREKVREFAAAVGEEHPLHHDPDAAREAGYADVVAPPMFAVVYSSRPLASALFDPAVGIDFARMVHGGQEFVWGPAGGGGGRDRDRGRGQGHLRARRPRLLRVREPLDQPGRRDGLHRHLDQHRPMSALEPGQALPDLKVTPDKYLTVRYAGASGDFNPIHIDEEFAQSVGLPGRILHGLWMMAQVARSVSAAGDGPEALRSLSIQFRGMGFPEQELTVSATVKEVADGVATVEAEAFQDGRRIIRKGKAELTRGLNAALLTIDGMLSPRQELLLGKVVDLFAEAGQPVGSKALASDEEIAYGPSTIRNELAVLEELGLLAHPHTSAGRVPTDAGYRYFVDQILPQRRSTAIEPRVVELTLVRREVDEAMRVTTETLSQVTNLLAIVSAPPIATTTIRHVEVLALQPQVLMVVIITSTGGVSKRIFAFERARRPRPGRLGRRLPQRAARRHGPRRADAALAARGPARCRRRSARSSARLAPAFTELAETAEDTLYVDGTARLLSRVPLPGPRRSSTR